MLSNTFKALLTLAAAFVACPLRYHYAAPGLDPSWAWVLNEAARQGLVAGRDFAFTYGPLAWIALPMNDRLAAGLTCQLLLWLLWLLLALWLAWRAPLANVAGAALCVYAGAGTFTRFGFAGPDIFIAFTVLVALACAVEPSRWRGGFWTIAVSLTVLLCFIKLSTAIFALSAVAMWPLAMYRFDRGVARRFAITGVAGLAGGFVAGFLLHAGTLAGMSDYVHASLDIGSGYSVAMSLPNQSKDLVDVALAVLAFLAFVAAILWKRTAATVVALATLGPLFLTYKHASVRPAGHIEIMFTTLPLLLAVILLAARFTRRDWPAAVALLAVIAVEQSRLILQTPQFPAVFGDLRKRLDEQSRAALAADIIPGLPVDLPMAVFPSESAYAAANHFPLRIFPIPQAYSAYTPFLDEKSARFVENDLIAPARILFDWTSIDGRHPLLDVPAWSLAMIRHYGLGRELADHFVLERLRDPRFGELRLLKREPVRLNQRIRVDPRKALVAKLHLKWNLRGSLAKFAYQVPELRMILSGQQRVIAARVVPDTLADGIMVNFEPSDLRSLRDLLVDNYVRDPFTDLSFAGDALAYLSNEGEIEWFEVAGWNPRMDQPAPVRLTMSHLGVTQTAKIESVGALGVSEYGRNEVISADCPGYLSVQGWAFDALRNHPAQAVYLELDDTLFTADYGGLRMDNVALFNNVALKNTGYTASIPLSRLGASDHTLRLKVVASDGQSYSDGEQAVRFRCRAAAADR